MSEPIIMPETLQPYHPENNPIGFIKEKSEYDKAYYKIMRNTALFLREKKLKEEAGEDVSNCVKLQKPYPQIPRISSIYEKKETTGTGSTDADSQGADAEISDKQGADSRVADAGTTNAQVADEPKCRNNRDAAGCDARIPTVPKGRNKSDSGISDSQGADAEISDKQGADERVKDARSKDSRSGRNNSDARTTDAPGREATIRTVSKCRNDSRVCQNDE